MEVARESIFVSALKSFCRMFFGVIGILIACFVFSLIYSSTTPSPLVTEKTTPEIVADADGKRELLSASTPAILQIEIHGVIGEPQKLDSETISNVLLDSRTGILAGDRVKGVLLHINTPGGTSTDSDTIYRMLDAYKTKYKVPIFAYVDGLCASGGMYVASAADQIFASPSSVIGSIGVVIGPFINAYDLMGKVGLKARTLTEGIDKDMMNPLRPWVEGEDASLKAVSAFLYQQFVDIVTTARSRLDRTKLVQEYGAQIYDCVKAEQLGYIDHSMSNRDDALRSLLQAAGLDAAKPYQVITLTPKNVWLSQLFSGKSPLFTGKIEHALDVGQPAIQGRFAYLYQP